MVGVFAGIPPAKLCKIRVHAPVVLQVAGGMDDAEEAIQSLARRGGWFNGEAFVNPYVLEGEKTISYELAIQSGWDPPEAVAFPLGSAADAGDHDDLRVGQCGERQRAFQRRRRE